MKPEDLLPQIYRELRRLAAAKQDEAPIVEAMAAHPKKSSTSFGVPGHKGDKGASSDGGGR